MGTLTEQPPRKYRFPEPEEVEIMVNQVKSLAEKHEISFDQSLRIFELLEKERSNSLAVDNGNIWDEQIGGIGKILEKMADSLRELENRD